MNNLASGTMVKMRPNGICMDRGKRRTKLTTSWHPCRVKDCPDARLVILRMMWRSERAECSNRLRGQEPNKTPACVAQYLPAGAAAVVLVDAFANTRDEPKLAQYQGIRGTDSRTFAAFRPTAVGCCSLELSDKLGISGCLLWILK